MAKYSVRQEVQIAFTEEGLAGIATKMRKILADIQKDAQKVGPTTGGVRLQGAAQEFQEQIKQGVSSGKISPATATKLETELKSTFAEVAQLLNTLKTSVKTAKTQAKEVAQAQLPAGYKPAAKTPAQIRAEAEQVTVKPPTKAELNRQAKAEKEAAAAATASAEQARRVAARIPVPFTAGTVAEVGLAAEKARKKAERDAKDEAAALAYARRAPGSSKVGQRGGASEIAAPAVSATRFQEQFAALKAAKEAHEKEAKAAGTLAVAEVALATAVREEEAPAKKRGKSKATQTTVQDQEAGKRNVASEAKQAATSKDLAQAPSERKAQAATSTATALKEEGEVALLVVEAQKALLRAKEAATKALNLEAGEAMQVVAATKDLVKETKVLVGGEKAETNETKKKRPKNSATVTEKKAIPADEKAGLESVLRAYRVTVIDATTATKKYYETIAQLQVATGKLRNVVEKERQALDKGGDDARERGRLAGLAAVPVSEGRQSPEVLQAQTESKLRAGQTELAGDPTYKKLRKTQEELVEVQRKLKVEALKQVVDGEIVTELRKEEIQLKTRISRAERKIAKDESARADAEEGIVPKGPKGPPPPADSGYGRLQQNLAGQSGFTANLGKKFLTTMQYALAGLSFRSALQGIGSMIKQAEELQRTFALIKIQFTDMDRTADFPRFRSAMLDIARVSGISAVEVARIGSQIAGVFKGDTTRAIQETGAAIRAALVTGLPEKEIVDSLTAASLAFGVSIDTITDKAVGLEERFGVLASESIKFFGDISETSKLTGLSLDELGTTLGVLQQKLGVSGGALSEQFARLLGSVTDNIPQLVEIFGRYSGLQAHLPDLATAIPRGSGAALFELAKGWNQLGQSEQEAIARQLGGARGFQTTLVALTGLNQEIVKGNVYIDDNGKAVKREAELQKTFSQQLLRVRETMRQLGDELGKSGLADFAALAFQAFGGLLGIMRGLVGLTGGWAGKIVGALLALTAMRVVLLSMSTIVRAYAGGGIVGAAGAAGRRPAAAAGGLFGRGRVPETEAEAQARAEAGIPPRRPLFRSKAAKAAEAEEERVQQQEWRDQRDARSGFGPAPGRRGGPPVEAPPPAWLKEEPTPEPAQAKGVFGRVKQRRDAARLQQAEAVRSTTAQTVELEEATKTGVLSVEEGKIPPAPFDEPIPGAAVEGAATAEGEEEIIQSKEGWVREKLRRQVARLRDAEMRRTAALQTNELGAQTEIGAEGVAAGGAAAPALEEAAALKGAAGLGIGGKFAGLLASPGFFAFTIGATIALAVASNRKEKARQQKESDMQVLTEDLSTLDQKDREGAEKKIAKIRELAAKPDDLLQRELSGFTRSPSKSEQARRDLLSAQVQDSSKTLEPMVRALDKMGILRAQSKFKTDDAIQQAIAKAASGDDKAYRELSDAVVASLKSLPESQRSTYQKVLESFSNAGGATDALSKVQASVDQVEQLQGVGRISSAGYVKTIVEARQNLELIIQGFVRTGQVVPDAEMKAYLDLVKKEQDAQQAIRDLALAGANATIDVLKAGTHDPTRQAKLSQQQAANSLKTAKDNLASQKAQTVKVYNDANATLWEEGRQKRLKTANEGLSRMQAEVDRLSAPPSSAKKSPTGGPPSSTDVLGAAHAADTGLLDLAKKNRDDAAAIVQGILAEKAPAAQNLTDAKKLYDAAVKASGGTESSAVLQAKVDLDKATAASLEADWAVQQRADADEDAQTRLARTVAGGAKNALTQAKRKREDADTALKRAVAEGLGPGAEANAKADQIEADRSIADAMFSIGQSRIKLVQAMASAAGQDVKAAEESVKLVRNELTKQLADDPTDTQAINDLRASLVAARDQASATRVSHTKELLDFQVQMGEITVGQEIAGLQALLASPDVQNNENRVREIRLAIRNLQKQTAGDLQFNIGDLRLPTLYEVRRMGQTQAAGQGYQDNRQVAITITVNNQGDLDGALQAFTDAVNAPTRYGTSARAFAYRN